MIITNFNEMSLEELSAINIALGIALIIEDGNITGTLQEQKIPADRKSNRD